MRQFENIQFTVNGETKKDLQLALELAFKENKITHWIIDKKEGLVLFYDVPEEHKSKLNPFITPSHVFEIIDEVWAWNLNQNPEDYQATGWNGEPIEDHYTAYRGWSVYAQSWGLSHLSVIEGQIPCFIIKPTYVWR